MKFRLKTAPLREGKGTAFRSEWKFMDYRVQGSWISVPLSVEREEKGGENKGVRAKLVLVRGA